jgi:hypothetical protein
MTSNVVYLTCSYSHSLLKFVQYRELIDLERREIIGKQLLTKEFSIPISF